MNTKKTFYIQLLAALYLWISCMVFFHSHDKEQTVCPSHGISHENSDPHHHHNDENCTLCFFIQYGTVEISDFTIAFTILQKTLNTTKYYDVEPQYNSYKLYFKSNKDPPKIA